MSDLIDVTLTMPDLSALPLAAGEAELIAAARDGSPEEFGELVTLHEGRVLRTAWRLLGDAEEARDAAQEVFLRAFRARRRLDPARDPAPWLYRITVNVCLTALRRRARRAAEPLGEEHVAAPGLGVDGGQERAVEAEEAQRFVREALAELTPRERAVLVLRDLEELDAAEVAASLRCATVTVRSHLSRARVKLARRLTALRRTPQ